MNYRFTAVAFVLSASAMCASLSAAGPDVVSSETRTYEIRVDRAAVGQSSLTIARYSDGTEVATTDAKLTVTWTVFKYAYEFHGQERWSQGRLQELSSRAVDGGKRLTLSAVQTERGWRIAKSSGPAALVGDVQLTTNYWKWPRIFAAGGQLSILDADNGKTYNVRCTPAAPEELQIGETRVLCNHFRLTNDIQSELWFDAAGYLVRHLGTEEGHATEVRLLAVPRQTLVLAKTAD